MTSITKNINSGVIQSNLKLLQIFIILKNLTNTNLLVGGVVRDLLLEKEPKDFDIVTDFDIHQLAPILVDNGWRVKETGTVFKILFVSEPDNNIQWTEEDVKSMGWCLELFKKTKNQPPELQNFEIANFRKDSLESDGRRPTYVETITINDTINLSENIVEDALRRDFTINSLYLEPFSMEIIDPTGQGIHDIQSRTLRFNLDPHSRIEEDYLRLWRAYRFTTKGFTLHQESLDALRNLYDIAHNKTTPERIRLEIEKMISNQTLDNSKGRLGLDNPKISECNNFIFDEVNKYVSFNIKVEQILMKNPIDIYKIYHYAYNGYTPTPNTLRSIREYFNKVHTKVKPEEVKTFIEQMLSIT